MYAARRAGGSMLSRSRVATGRVGLQKQQCRSAQTVPRAGTEDQMKAEALEQIKARVAYQKELMKERGHSYQEEVDEMWKWTRISIIVAFPICVLSSVKDVTFGDHPHVGDDPQPDYMKIRNKAFPWECEDCELFNLKCWRACKAEKRAGN